MLVAVSFFLLGFSVVGISAKAMYEYKDKKGVASYTDDYDNIPAQYRKSAKKIVQLPEQVEQSLNKPIETLSAPSNVSSISSAVVNTAPPDATAHNKGLMDETWLKATGGGVGFTALILFGMKLGALTGNKILGSIFGLILASGLLIYMFEDNLEKLMESFRTAKQDIGVVQKIMNSHVDKVNRMTNEK